MQQRRDAPRHRARRDSCAGGNEWQQALVLWLCGAKGRKVTGLEQAKPTAPHWGVEGEKDRNLRARRTQRSKAGCSAAETGDTGGARRSAAAVLHATDGGGRERTKNVGNTFRESRGGRVPVELCVRTTLPLCGGRVERGGGVPYSERKNRQAAMNHASADEARKGWT
ncbi:hypothetical protein ERJ75_001475000 [Trypanosoma vivax]|nr:hypothetical protein ERJ75_001475000 [Trypanosoma vivax]